MEIINVIAFLFLLILILGSHIIQNKKWDAQIKASSFVTTALESLLDISKALINAKRGDEVDILKKKYLEKFKNTKENLSLECHINNDYENSAMQHLIKTYAEFITDLKKIQ